MNSGRTHKRIKTTDQARNILLAEDDLEMRKLLSWSLERKGYKVTECGDGTALMKKLGLLGPGKTMQSCDLIISDNRMPGATGLEVLASVREFPDFPPMILITAFPDAESRDLAIRLGAVAIMAKPFNIDDLIVKVKETIPPRTVNRRRSIVRPAAGSTLSFPFDVTFRHHSGSQAVKDTIHDLAKKLETFGEHISNGKIIVDQSDQFHHKKHYYTITLVLSTSSKTIAVKHNSNSGASSDNLYMALHVAFGIAIRKLKHHLEKQQAQRKHVTRPIPYTDAGD
jgi:CheY-like chemotaxis protein